MQIQRLGAPQGNAKHAKSFSACAGLLVPTSFGEPSKYENMEVNQDERSTLKERPSMHNDIESFHSRLKLQSQAPNTHDLLNSQIHCEKDGTPPASLYSQLA